jgi:hypothetical protein
MFCCYVSLVHQAYSKFWEKGKGEFFKKISAVGGTSKLVRIFKIVISTRVSVGIPNVFQQL